jgi:hypothetical protein
LKHLVSRAGLLGGLKDGQEGFAIKLSVGIERKTREGMDHSRHHVRRETGFDGVKQAGGIDGIGLQESLNCIGTTG